MNPPSELKPLIFCSAKTQYENLGDLLINKTLFKKLRNFGEIVVNNKGVSEKFSADLCLQAAEKSSNYSLHFRLLILARCLRSLLQDRREIHYVMQPGHVNGSSYRTVRLQLSEFFYLCILRVCGVSISRFGASVGPFSGIGNSIEQWKSKLVSFYSVRETISKQYAEGIGVRGVHLFPDLAWLIEAKPSVILKDGYAVVSFRSFTHELAGGHTYEAQLHKILDEIVRVVCQDCSKQLVIAYQVTKDFDFCRSLQDRYSSQYNLVFIEDSIDLGTAEDLYSQASMVFSNRLHVLLLGMLHGALPFAVVDKNHHKIIGILSDAGLSESIINLETPPDRVANVLRAALSNSALIKQKLFDQFKKNKASADFLFCKVF